MRSKSSRNATSSPESADGPLQLDWVDGLTTESSGPDPAPASLSPWQALGVAMLTKDTSGQNSPASSKSATLQSSLESKLRARLEGRGSPEYVLTWKHWDMESGPPICALRASARRTFDSGSSGWPTPTLTDPKGSRNATVVRSETAKPFALGTTLTNAAWFMAGWPTTKHDDGVKSIPSFEGALKEAQRKGANDLNTAAVLAGWVTLSARDWKDAPGMSTQGTNPDGSTRQRLDQLPRQAAIAGRGAASTSLAPTERRGALNPELSRWLMGFSAAWDACAPTGTPSSRKSRQSSSQQS